MSYELSDPGTRDVRTAAHRTYLDSRLDGIDDPDERVNEILAQHARFADPENCTDDDLALLLGRNWRNVLGVIRQAARLTREQAEKIAASPLGPNWELDLEEAENALPETEVRDDTAFGEAVEAATDHTWSKGGPFWEAHDAFSCALMATMAGDRISEATRRDLMRAWGAAFSTEQRCPR
jgi:plasmid maintenance system antidote protein VapI